RLFEAPTIADLARVIEEARPGGRGARALSPPPPPRGQLLPPSFAPRRPSFIDPLEPGTPPYNNPPLPRAPRPPAPAPPLRATGPLDAALLRRTLAAVMLRHEALRTTFGERSDELMQLVSPVPAADLEHIDLTPLPEPARGREAARLALLEAMRPFDLSRG